MTAGTNTEISVNNSKSDSVNALDMSTTTRSIDVLNERVDPESGINVSNTLTMDADSRGISVSNSDLSSGTVVVNDLSLNGSGKTAALTNIDESNGNKVANRVTLNATDKTTTLLNSDEGNGVKIANSMTLDATGKTAVLENRDDTTSGSEVVNGMTMDAAGKTVTLSNVVGDGSTVKNEVFLDAENTVFKITNSDGTITNELSFNAATGAFSIGSVGGSREAGITFDPDEKAMVLSDTVGNSVELYQNANSKESIKIKDGTGNIIITDEFGIRLEAASGKKILLGESNYSKGGVTNCNNLPACLFSGAPHGTSAVQVPMLVEPLTEITKYEPNILGTAEV